MSWCFSAQTGYVALPIAGNYLQTPSVGPSAPTMVVAVILRGEYAVPGGTVSKICEDGGASIHAC